MHIEHIAIWTKQLEVLKNFYVKYFKVIPSEKYTNPKKGFSSYFLSFENGCRLEIMEKEGIPANINNLYDEYIGLIHFAISVGNKEKVDEMTEVFRKDGFEIVGEPRITGDGYYESVIFDPDKNRIEITI